VSEWLLLTPNEKIFNCILYHGENKLIQWNDDELRWRCPRPCFTLNQQNYAPIPLFWVFVTFPLSTQLWIRVETDFGSELDIVSEWTATCTCLPADYYFSELALHYKDQFKHVVALHYKDQFKHVSELALHYKDQINFVG
jgi:hypothetical protein